MRFSPTTQTCYPKHIGYSSLPDDIMDLTDDQLALVRSCNVGEVVLIANGKLTVAAKPGPTADKIAAANMIALKSTAQVLLDKSDITLIRCLEHGVAIPPAWVAYRAELRNILNTGAGVMPNRPPYPEGT